MARFLFAMFQGGGNTHLILPVAARLVEHGHDVRILAGPGIRASRAPINERFIERIQKTGARLFLLKEPDTHPLDEATMPSLPFVRDPGSPAGRIARVGLFSVTAWSRTWALQTREQLSSEPADVLAADYHLPGAMAAGEALRVPTAALVHAIPWRPMPQMPPFGFGWAPARSPWTRLAFAACGAVSAYVNRWKATPLHNAARKELRLASVRSWFEQYDRIARVLVFVHQAFDFPARLAPNVRYVGTPFDDDAFKASDWTPPWPRDDASPLVLVSLSTLPQGQGPLLRRIIETLGDMPVSAVVTVGPALNLGDLTPPPNVRLYPFLPHAAVLPHVQAMVTQCGTGTVAKGLSHGVPLICAPLVADQPDNAIRVRELGAGLIISNSAGTSQIREAISRILSEPRFRGCAEKYAEKVRDSDGTANTTRELESLVRG